jgi:hypothetical protein
VDPASLAADFARFRFLLGATNGEYVSTRPAIYKG